VNLLDMDTEWVPADCRRHGVHRPCARQGRRPLDRQPVSISIFGSHSELRALAEVYAVQRLEGEVRARLRGALDKVMNQDRFDVAASA
jgi:catalase-peroxidase